MKLSPAFLAYKLSSAFSVLAPENLPLSGTLELPVLYQTGSAATVHRVFLCTEEQIGSLSSLPEESSSLFLLCTEELPEELPAPVSIAVKSSVSAVFSFLQELFWTYDSWQKELMQARLDGKSIQHLLNLSLPVFAHPLMVVGMDFSIIAAASEEPSFFPEKVFGSLDATRPLLLSLTESSEYASVRDLDGWFRFPDHVTGLGSLCVNITQHGQSAYRLLGLQTFFTAGADECRAWTIHVGDKAPKAAGVIHSDFEKGFIRAEVIKYEDFVHYKTEAAVRAAGKMGIEGKEYVVCDGDIMHFLFNV